MSDLNFQSNFHHPFTMGDLSKRLDLVSVDRCRAILFALESSVLPKDVIGITWKEIRERSLPALAKVIVENCPRHFRLPYVFWETQDTGLQTPLFGLHESFLEVSDGLSFQKFQQLYNEMLWLDNAADANDLRQICATAVGN